MTNKRSAQPQVRQEIEAPLEAQTDAAESFMESLPSRETFPINRTETLEMLRKFAAWLNRP